MIVAIASTGDTSTAKLDPRFGRCAFFALYKAADGSLQFYPNPNRDAEDWAGRASVQWIRDHHANLVIAGEMGEKIKPMLDKHQIQIAILENSELRIFEIVEMLQQNNKNDNSR